MVLALLEVADKIPHPALSTWIATHLVLATFVSLVHRRRLLHRASLACALTWLGCVSVWLGSFFVSPDSIDEGFVDEVGVPYLAAVLLASALPAAVAVASARRRTPADSEAAD